MLAQVCGPPEGWQGRLEDGPLGVSCWQTATFEDYLAADPIVDTFHRCCPPPTSTLSPTTSSLTTSRSMPTTSVLTPTITSLISTTLSLTPTTSALTEPISSSRTTTLSTPTTSSLTSTTAPVVVVVVALALRHLLHAQATGQASPSSQMFKLADWELAAMAGAVVATLTAKSDDHQAEGLGELARRPPCELLQAQDALQSSLRIVNDLLHLTTAAHSDPRLRLDPATVFSGRRLALVYVQAAAQAAEGLSPVVVFSYATSEGTNTNTNTPTSSDDETTSNLSDEAATTAYVSDGWDWTFGGLLQGDAAGKAKGLLRDALWGAPVPVSSSMVAGKTADGKARA
eukprot:scaffold139433_cov20-Prasinocladus_malaysianus.AAC.1